jgi:integrase
VIDDLHRVAVALIRRRCGPHPPDLSRSPTLTQRDSALHAARHTCATLMHLQGVPVAVIAAWIGHKDATLTMRLCAHSQAEALKAAGATLNRVVSPACH